MPKEISYSIPIVADILTTNVSELGGSGNMSLDSSTHRTKETSLFTVTVLPDLTFGQHLENLSNLLSPVNLILGFLTAVGAVLAPLIVRIYSRKRHGVKKT